MDELTIREKLIPKIDNFKCYNSHLRIVNFSIYSEFVKAKREGRKDWADRASKWLCEKHGIVRTPGTLIGMLASIRNRSRSAISASGFIGDDLDPQSRYEKDIFYGKLEVYVHEFLCDFDKHYVGLPANQLMYVAQKYDTVVACERDQNMAYFIRDLNRFIIKKSNVVVENSDIFDYLMATEKKFNVYDLDLMTHLTEAKIKNIVKSIKRTAAKRAVVALVSIGGRHITIKEYKTLMPEIFINEMEYEDEWCVVGNFSGKYKDIKMPMFWEIFTIERHD